MPSPPDDPARAASPAASGPEPTVHTGVDVDNRGATIGQQIIAERAIFQILPPSLRSWRARLALALVGASLLLAGVGGVRSLCVPTEHPATPPPTQA